MVDKTKNGSPLTIVRIMSSHCNGISLDRLQAVLWLGDGKGSIIRGATATPTHNKCLPPEVYPASHAEKKAYPASSIAW